MTSSLYYDCHRFFENQPNKICRHLSEKALKGGFLGPDKLRTHTNEGKGEEKKKERARRKKRGEEKKAMVELLVSIMAILEKKNCLTQKVYLAVTFSKIRLDIRAEGKLRKSSEACL